MRDPREGKSLAPPLPGQTQLSLGWTTHHPEKKILDPHMKFTNK